MGTAQGGSAIMAGTAAPGAVTGSPEATGAVTGAPEATGAVTGAPEATGAVTGETTAAGSGGKVCNFPKDVTGQLYTIPDIKTNEAGTLKFVFEKPKAGSISMKIVDHPEISWNCGSSTATSS